MHTLLSSRPRRRALSERAFTGVIQSSTEDVCCCLPVTAAQNANQRDVSTSVTTKQK